jgi:putative ABC transport system permease protein
MASNQTIMAFHQLKLARRNFSKNRGYNGLNILGLAIGIACAGLIFLWIQDELTFDDVHVNKDRLYQLEVNLSTAGNNFTMGSTPRPMGAAMKAEIPGIARTARYLDVDQRMLFQIDGKSMYASGRFCDADLFGMFSFTFTQGDPQNPFPQLYSLVITESEAHKLFGTDKEVVNKVIRVVNAGGYSFSGTQDFVISGVVKDPPENSSLQFEYLAPYEVINKQILANGGGPTASDWMSYGPLTYVELDKNADVGPINAKLKDFIRRKAPSEDKTTFLYPMKDWRLYDEFANGKPTGGGRIREVRTLSAIAWIILLIACINFMNLATATSQKRAKEVGVRKVLGAERRKLVWQFLGEALFMSFLAAAAGVLIMELALPAFSGLMDKHLHLRLSDPVEIVALLVIAVVCGLVAGSYPAFYLSSFNPIGVLKGLKMKTGGAPLVRKALVVIQFAVSVVFIISTLVIYLQIQHIKNRDLGFNRDRLIEIDPETQIGAIFPLIKNEFLQTGLVENVALADHETLYGGDTDDRFKWQGQTAGNAISIAHRNVTPGYVATSGMKIVAGRDFRENDATDENHVIINESMARLMGPGSAVGKIIQSPRNADGRYTDMTVIGVVGNYVYGDVTRGGVPPVIFFRKAPEYQNFIYVRPKAQAGLAQVVASIEAIMKKNNPAYPAEYQFVDQEFNRMFGAETQTSKVSGVFAVLAILISCLGLFGLAAFTAEQRTKEIGIRKVLGASVAGITTLLTRNFLVLVGLSCVIAFPAAWWMMHSWLQDYEFRIALGWWMFAAAGVIAVLIALVTIGFQSIKAALASPVTSLRSE